MAISPRNETGWEISHSNCKHNLSTHTHSHILAIVEATRPVCVCCAVYVDGCSRCVYVCVCLCTDEEKRTNDIVRERRILANIHSGGGSERQNKSQSCIPPGKKYSDCSVCSRSWRWNQSANQFPYQFVCRTLCTDTKRDKERKENRKNPEKVELWQNHSRTILQFTIYHPTDLKRSNKAEICAIILQKKIFFYSLQNGEKDIKLKRHFCESCVRVLFSQLFWFLFLFFFCWRKLSGRIERCKH